MVRGAGVGGDRGSVFQYSLCRVVLMVFIETGCGGVTRGFQYSLCRVVLMVLMTYRICQQLLALSVLALSSRFDGHRHLLLAEDHTAPFSTRSVESF